MTHPVFASEDSVKLYECCYYVSLHRSEKKNVEFVLEKIGVISKVVFPVESKSGLRTTPACQVFE